MNEHKREGHTPYHQVLAGADAPIASTGACKNTSKRVRRGAKIVPKCSNFNTALGNGLCITCWDYEVDRRSNSAEERRMGSSNNGFKNLPS